jgi:hypothetical protein
MHSMRFLTAAEEPSAPIRNDAIAAGMRKAESLANNIDIAEQQVQAAINAGGTYACRRASFPCRTQA